MSLRYDRCAPKHGADMAMTRFVMYVRSRSKPDCVYVCVREREGKRASVGMRALVKRRRFCEMAMNIYVYVCICMYMHVYARICMYMYVYV